MTATFDDWRDGLSDSVRAVLMFSFLEDTWTVCGTVSGVVQSRAPWIGATATVEVNLVDKFDDYLRDNVWPGR